MATNWAGFIPLNIPYASVGSGFVPYVNGPGWNSLGNYNLAQYGAVNGWGPAVANGGQGIRQFSRRRHRRDLSAALRPARRMELGRRAAAQRHADGHRGETWNGGYVEASYKYEDKDFGTGVYFPFVKWQYYNGGFKFDNNAPKGRVNEWDVGVRTSPCRNSNSPRFILTWTAPIRLQRPIGSSRRIW